MKRLKVLALYTILCVGLSLAASCRDSAGNKSGTRAGEESNGDTRGTEKPAGNEGSGSSPDAGPADKNNGQ